VLVAVKAIAYREGEYLPVDADYIYRGLRLELV